MHREADWEDRFDGGKAVFGAKKSVFPPGRNKHRLKRKCLMVTMNLSSQLRIYRVI